MTFQIKESTFLLKAVLSDKQQECVKYMIQQPGAAEFILQEFEKYRIAGNLHFKNEDFTEAVKQYTICIRLGYSLAKSGNKKTLSKLPLETLKLVASNRAQACLELRFWQLALTSAEEALRFDPKHIKSLFRKGKACEGLQEWKKAIEAFESALELSTSEAEIEYIEKSLEAVRTAYHQSITGEYDLRKFSLVGGIPPLCSDYVGPVEIRNTPTAGRGIYLTQPVEIGALIMAANALGVGGADPNCDPPSAYVVNLAYEIQTQIPSSQRYAHQVYHLRSGLETLASEGAIPPLELYIPGSDWAPDPENKIETLPFEEFFAKVKVNSFDASQVTSPGLFSKGWNPSLVQNADKNKMQYCAVWALPSFLNHSCVPNCFTFCVGKTMFVRAAESLPAGTELTIAYVVSELVDRKDLTTTWDFLCNCEKCQFDKFYQPHIQELLTTSEKMTYDYAEAESTKRRRAKLETQTFSMYGEFCREIDSVEKKIKELSSSEEFIKKLPMELQDKHKNWMRFPFHRLYYIQLFLARNICTNKEKIELLKSLLEIYNSVNTGNGGFTLHLAASLLQGAEVEYGTSSMEYQRTKRYAKAQFQRMLGKITDEFFLELLETKFWNSEQVYRMTGTRNHEMPQEELKVCED